MSDADRDLALAELRDGFAAGRLSHDTFLHRVDAALQARFHGELDGLVADLRRRSRGRRRGPAGATSIATPRGAQASQRVRARVEQWLRRRPAVLPLPPGVVGGRFTIGREPACDMTLVHLSVSRWHACLHRETSGWLLTDLGSTNGTRLNGWRVAGSPVPVRPGDIVSFGRMTFVLADRPG